MRFRLAVMAALALLVVGAHASERKRIVLEEGWYVKQLETAKPVIGDLIRSLGNPDDGWMKATMPAQTRIVRIIDPAGSPKVIVKALNAEPVCLTATP